MKDQMLYKDIGCAVKDVDTVTGRITGYFSKFGNKDSDGDIIMPGAFRKTIRENGPKSAKPRILHLYMHDVYKPLAKPDVLREDKNGLYFEDTISHTTLGKDVIQLYQDKVLTEHSIGYQVIKREVDDPDQDYRTRTQKLIELKLYEGSTVSWGANMEALVETVKGENVPTKKTIDLLIEKMDIMEKAIKGDYSDDTIRQMEIQFKQIQQIIISLARKSEPEPPTHEPEKPEKEITAEYIIKKLNIKI